LIFIHPEDGFKDMHHEIHGCEVVIEQQHLVKRWGANIQRLFFQECCSFLCLSMVRQVINLRGERQIFNGFGLKRLHGC
jgi:hypothetical protein